MGKTREPALEPRSSRGPKASPNGILAHVDGSQWGRVTKYFDEVTHAELPGHLVKAARAEDIEYFNSLPVWDIVKTRECWDVTGSSPITTKWVDVNKGDQT